MYMLKVNSFKKQVFINSLDESFFWGMRSDINTKELKKLATFAKSIPEPILFGTYRDELHYAKTLDLFLKSTDETRRLGLFIKRAVFPLLITFDRLLEIGSGSGRLIHWFGNSFKHVTAVDINKKMLDELNKTKRILRNSIQFEKIHASLFNADLKKNSYNLTLLSHVLYYIDRSEWLNAVKLAYNVTCPNGFLLIVMSGNDLGKAALIKHFGGEPIQIDSLTEQCQKLFGSDFVQIFESDERIVSEGLLPILHIGGFFLCDARVTATKQALTTYLQAYCQKKNNFYEITSRQKYILIKKAPS